MRRTSRKLRPAQRRGMSLAIVAQVFGMLADIAFRNGILLVYFTALRVDGDRVLLYLSLPPVLMLVVRLPAAHLADHIGLKRVGGPGFALSAVGFTLFLLAGFAAHDTAEWLILAGVVAHGTGLAIASAGFMPLLRRIVPQKLRGRFFGRLHVSWQFVGLLFVAGCAVLLPAEATVRMYQVILAILVVGAMVRVVMYLRIAEPAQPGTTTHGFFQSIARTMRIEGYAPFGAYLFLLALCTGAAPFVFGLLEKHALRFGDNEVVWMGNLIMVGSLIGFALGGKATDRWGTKPVFLVCHFGYGTVLTMLLMRGVCADGRVVCSGVDEFVLWHVLGGVVDCDHDRDAGAGAAREPGDGGVTGAVDVSRGRGVVGHAGVGGAAAGGVSGAVDVVGHGDEPIRHAAAVMGGDGGAAGGDTGVGAVGAAQGGVAAEHVARGWRLSDVARLSWRWRG